jgi:hypothetical protein
MHKEDGNVEENMCPPILSFEDHYITTESCNWRNGALVDNIIVYIGGFVVRRAFKRITCIDCREQLIATVPNPRFSSTYLQQLRNRGGLVFPSNGVVKVLTAKKHVIRTPGQLRLLTGNFNNRRIALEVLARVGSESLFETEHGIVTTVGIDNHTTDLIRIITDIYLDVRKHHIARLQNEDLMKSFLLSKLNRSVIFAGQ